MVKRNFIVLVALLAAAPALAPHPRQPTLQTTTVNLSEAARRLKFEQPERDAIAAISWAPDSIEETTCGQGDGSRLGWHCRILRYNSAPNGKQQTLQIFEHEADGEWRVLNWIAF
ncbi:MAG TPA: hypothetical protein VED47_10230 [Burkholderiaceae bacterium]|nr:hypothetical protein [Burkholderiaceae bacterium]